LESGTISNNTADSGGGLFSKGTSAILSNTTFRGNIASYGGAIYIEGGAFTMEDKVSISNNTSNWDGGGLYVNGGTYTMQGGTILSNTASGNDGGAVYVYDGTFTMQGGSISGNIAASWGGGVRVSNGIFILKGGTISGNKANYAGGGVYNYRGKFTMEGGTISSNTTREYGGGVVIDSNGTFTKTGGTIYGDDADLNLRNTVTSRMGHAVYNGRNDGNWRNVTAGLAMNTDTYGFWLNDGDVITFPSSFTGNWKRNNFDNILSFTKNTLKSNSRNFLWILQSISGNTYTFKRADASNTLTITIRLDGNKLVISGDSGNGENNWNGTWMKQ